MSTYVLGDIQGCYRELRALLESIRFEPKTDELWCVGDLINRGPDNLSAINLLRSLPNSKIVLGNHDLHFLAVATGAQAEGKSDTLGDLLHSPALQDIIDWMRHLPLAYYNPDRNCLLVHAGVPPVWSVPDLLGYAAEVEVVLRGVNHQAFFSHMYGNNPNRWDTRLSGWDRYRLITNYLTRMRYCKADGELELTHKENKTPPGFAPWFTFPRSDTTTVLFGHWAAIEGRTSHPRYVALDTGCVWGRSLSAIRLDDMQLFSVPAQYRE